MSTGQTDVINHLVAQNKELLKALENIKEGRGAYSRDPLTHASNTIDYMKARASTAVANTTPSKAGEFQCAS